MNYTTNTNKKDIITLDIFDIHEATETDGTFEKVESEVLSDYYSERDEYVAKKLKEDSSQSEDEVREYYENEVNSLDQVREELTDTISLALIQEYLYSNLKYLIIEEDESVHQYLEVQEDIRKNNRNEYKFHKDILLSKEEKEKKEKIEIELNSLRKEIYEEIFDERVHEEMDSPREWSPIGTFITYESRSSSPDKDTDPTGMHDTYRDLFDTINDRATGKRAGKQTKTFKRYCKLHEVCSDIHEVYLVSKYEHSSVRYSLGSSRRSFDGGVTGIYVVSKKLLKENVSDNVTEEQIESILREELDHYTNYVNGSFEEYITNDCISDRVTERLEESEGNSEVYEEENKTYKLLLQKLERESNETEAKIALKLESDIATNNSILKEQEEENNTCKLLLQQLEQEDVAAAISN